MTLEEGIRKTYEWINSQANPVTTQFYDEECSTQTPVMYHPV